MLISEQDTLVINQVFKDFDKFLEDYQDQEDYEFHWSVGLCSNVFDTLEERLTNHKLVFNLCEIAYKLFESWEHYTGSRSYPVPFITDKDQDAFVLDCVMRRISSDPYDAAYNAQRNLYDPTNDYGLLRRDLYQHIKDNIFNVIAEI